MRPRLFILLMVFSLSPLRSEETVLRKVPVPSRILRQGDALLIRSGGGIGVRIALETRHLRKVQEKILASEAANWPDSADSQRYREALEAACETALAAGDGKVNFQIDWLLTAEDRGVVRLASDAEAVQLDDLPADYLHKNLAYIMADNFNMRTDEAETWILENLKTLKEGR